MLGFNKIQNSTKGAYNIVSLCYEQNTCVAGGSKRMFRYFINKYNPSEVHATSDLAKYTGFVYDKLGFNIECITEPEYIWCDNHNNVFTDSQLTATNNNRLIKIHNSGNIKFRWHRDVNHKLERK